MRGCPDPLRWSRTRVERGGRRVGEGHVLPGVGARPDGQPGRHGAPALAEGHLRATPPAVGGLVRTSQEVPLRGSTCPDIDGGAVLQPGQLGLPQQRVGRRGDVRDARPERVGRGAGDLRTQGARHRSSQGRGCRRLVHRPLRGPAPARRAAGAAAAACSPARSRASTSASRGHVSDARPAQSSISAAQGRHMRPVLVVDADVLVRLAAAPEGGRRVPLAQLDGREHEVGERGVGGGARAGDRLDPRPRRAGVALEEVRPAHVRADEGSRVGQLEVPGCRRRERGPGDLLGARRRRRRAEQGVRHVGGDHQLGDRVGVLVVAVPGRPAIASSTTASASPVAMAALQTTDAR